MKSTFIIAFVSLVVTFSGAKGKLQKVVELPNVQLVDCQDVVALSGFDKCLKIKFSYLEEYAGLNEADRSTDILVGKLNGTDGAVNEESRVSVSIDGAVYYVSRKELFITEDVATKLQFQVIGS